MGIAQEVLLKIHARERFPQYRPIETWTSQHVCKMHLVRPVGVEREEVEVVVA